MYEKIWHDQCVEESRDFLVSLSVYFELFTWNVTEGRTQVFITYISMMPTGISWETRDITRDVEDENVLNRAMTNQRYCLDGDTVRGSFRTSYGLENSNNQLFLNHRDQTCPWNETLLAILRVASYSHRWKRPCSETNIGNRLLGFPEYQPFQSHICDKIWVRTWF